MSNLNAVLTEFFMAGVHTTGSTLAWIMLYMILHPDIQQAVQNELDILNEGQNSAVYLISDCLCKNIYL